MPTSGLRCEIDHLRDHARGGPTLVHNLCCLCERHHRAKHVAGFKLRLGLHGVDWQTPTGHRYTVVPDNRWLPDPVDFHLDQRLHHGPIGQLRR